MALKQVEYICLPCGRVQGKKLKEVPRRTWVLRCLSCKRNTRHHIHGQKPLTRKDVR